MTNVPQILMCPPDYYGIEYEINPWMNRQVSSDPAESRWQWWALRETLRDLGADVSLLIPVRGPAGGDAPLRALGPRAWVPGRDLAAGPELRRGGRRPLLR